MQLISLCPKTARANLPAGRSSSFTAAKEHLARIPVIVLDYPLAEIPATQPKLVPAVKFTTAVYGIHRPGTAYRMDEIPIPLRPVLASDYPSDDEVLAAILKAAAGR